MTIVDRRYSVAEGTAVKAPCRAATTANVALTGLQTIDGVVLVEHDRVLVKNQTDGTTNGIYAASTGNWTRERDFDGAYDIVSGTRVFVTSGSTNALYEFAVATADPVTVGTTAITFTPTGAASANASAAAAAVSASAAAASAVIASGFNWSTGDIKLTLKTTADSGWRMFDDGTIGDASSGASYANVAALALFTLLFASPFTDANCPLLTSSGSATTRVLQTDAATAWAAHCRISLPKTLGRALGMAGTGSGLTSRVAGATVGEETHLLSTPEIPSHTHVNTLTDPGHNHTYSQTPNAAGAGTGGAGTPINFTTSNTSTNTTGITITNANAGGGGAHNNMQPTTFLNAMVKL